MLSFEPLILYIFLFLGKLKRPALIEKLELFERNKTTNENNCDEDTNVENETRKRQRNNSEDSNEIRTDKIVNNGEKISGKQDKVAKRRKLNKPLQRKQNL